MTTEIVRANTTQDEYKTTEDAVEGFLKSERSYVENGLRLGYENFLKRLEVHNKLNRSIINDEDIRSIFGNYYTLYTANQQLYNDLMQLRLEGRQVLRDGLGSCMLDFIPYFRLYTDYIVNKRQAIAKVAHLQKSKKSFRNFVKISETCVQRKFKKFLEEPAERLPQYLQQMSDIYVSWEKETEDETNINARKTLLTAIINIKKVTDEIAVKCRDKKARKLVGALQQENFKNNVQLLARHRWVVTHATMNMVVKEKLKPHVFILCNDILVVSTPPSKFKAGSLVAVFPLIGLRLTKNPKIDPVLESSSKNRFALISQNKNFTPSESNSLNSIIIVCNNAKEMSQWIDIIEDTVDEEEHNLKPSNPVDLEKRLRKQTTSKEGQAETITITDPAKIAAIQEWKLERGSGKKRVKKANNNNNNNNNNSNNNASVAGAAPKRAPPSGSGRNRAHAPGSSLAAAGPPPKGPPPTRKSMSNVSANGGGGSGSGNHSSMKRGAPPKKQSTSVRHSMPPKSTPSKAPPSPNNRSTASKSKRTSVNVTAPKKPAPSPSSKSKTAGKPAKNRRSRMNLLSGIKRFESTNLVHIDAEALSHARDSSISTGPPNMQNLLSDTLANYRQFVMDDDHESSSESDNDWDD